MTKRVIRSVTLLGMTVAVIVACATQTAPPTPESRLMQARSKLLADVRGCSEQYGYYPQSVTGVAENALAPKELKWRQCAYDAVRAYASENPANRAYEQLIAEDIAMTTGIQQGSTTRSERRARDEQLIAQIRKAEEAQIQAVDAVQQSKTQEFQNVVEGLRGFAF